VHKKDVIAQIVHTKCAKLVDEKYNQLFCCVSVRDFDEPKILIKLYSIILQIKKKIL